MNSVVKEETSVPAKPLINYRVIAVATVGNALEWYDFTVFAFFATIIAKNFFPSADPTASMMATWATFGVGFLTRPLGGIVLGAYADRKGRKAALVVTIMTMALGVGIIACAPTYAQVGIFAPILMLIGRFLQGFSAGGEVGSATAFLVEHAPPEKRGFYGSFQQVSQAMSMILGSLTGIALTQYLSPEQLDAFGWRIPFFLGLLIIPVGLYVRMNLDESPVFKAKIATQKLEKQSAFFASIVTHWRAILAGFGLTIYGTISVYIFYYFMPSYAVKTLGMPIGDTVISSFFAAFSYLVMTIFSGYISDITGRKKPMVLSTLLVLAIAYPLFLLLTHYPQFSVLVLVQCSLMASLGLFQGAYCAFVCELFPAKIRSTGMSIGYNFAVMIFGGFAGAIATYLIGVTGDKMAVVYYGLFGAAMGFITISMLKDRTKQPLA